MEKRNLSLSEAAALLKVSPLTLKKLEKKGYIKSDQDLNGRRVYTRDVIQKFLDSDFFPKQKPIPSRISVPVDNLDQIVRGKSTHEDAGKDTPLPEFAETRKLLVENERQINELSALLLLDKKRVNVASTFQRALQSVIVSLFTLFILTVSVIVLCFFLFPEKTSQFFGYSSPSTAQPLSAIPTSESKYLATNAQVLGASTINSALKPKQNLLANILKPFSKVSLLIVKQVNDDVYKKVMPKGTIENINDVLTLDSEGRIVPVVGIHVPDSSYIKISDANNGSGTNLNDYVKQKIVIANENGEISVPQKQQVIQTPVTTVQPGVLVSQPLEDGSVTTFKIADGSVTAEKLASGVSVLGDNSISAKNIKDGEVSSGKISDGTIINADISDTAAITDNKLAQITSTDKVAGSAVELASGGGLVNNAGLSLTTSCNTNEILSWSGSAWVCTTNVGGGSGIASLNSLTGIVSIAGAGINTVSVAGGTITVTGTEADTLASVTGRGATTATTVALNGGLTSSSSTPISLSSVSPSISIGNTGTLFITDGSNTLLSLADNGTTGNLSVTGTINGATISGGILSGGSVSGGSLTATAVNGVTTADIALTTGSYADPAWITSLAGSKITGNISGNAATATNATTVTNGVYTTGSYADPSWLTSIAGSKVSGNISGNAATATNATHATTADSASNATDAVHANYADVAGVATSAADLTCINCIGGTEIDESTLAGLTPSNFASANISQWTNNAGYITDGNTNWDNSYGFITASSSDILTNKSGNISQWTNDSGYLTTVDVSSNTNLSASNGVTLTGDNLTNTDKGSSQNIFKTVAIAGQSNVVSDQNSDTLTFIAGSNVTLTTDASNDTITINATGGGGGGSYVAGNDLDLTGNTFSLQSTLDTVDTSNFAGTGTINGLDAIDATTKSTIENAIDTLGNLTSAASLATVGTLTGGVTGPGFTLDFGASTLSGDITGANIDESTLAGLTASNLTAGDFSSKITSGTYSINVSGNAATATSASNAATVTNGVYTTGSYANPSWITSLAGSKITGNISGNAATATNATHATTADSASNATDAVHANYADVAGTSTTSADLTCTNCIGGTEIDESTLTGLTTSIFTSANVSQWTNDAGYITDGNTNWDNSYGFITASSSDTLTNKTIAAGSNTITGLTASNLTAGDFSSKINSGTYSINVSGNAGTVTNGVYTTGSYADPAWISSVAGSKVTGNISGNAATATSASVAGAAAAAVYADTAGIATSAADLNCANCIGGTEIDESTLAGLTTSNFASGNISQWTNNSGYITGNQTITLSGDVSGSGTTAITTTIGAGKVGATQFGSAVSLGSGQTLSYGAGTVTANALASGTYGISVSGNAGTVTNGVYTTGSYADPSWLTSIAGSKVSGNISGNAATATNATHATTADSTSNATDAVHANYTDVAGTATTSAGLTCTNCVGGTQVDESTLALTKSMVGLGNVENTALSTWAGTSNVTTTGTLTSGATGAGFTLNFGTSTLSGNITGSNIDESTLAGLTTSNFSSANISQWTNNSGYITDGNTNWDNSYGFITASTSDTLTNKTIAAGSNTITGLTASNLTAGDFSSKINSGTYSIGISGNAASATNATTVTNGVYTTGSYANPSWLTSIDGAKITGTIAGSIANATDAVHANYADVAGTATSSADLNCTNCIGGTEIDESTLSLTKSMVGLSNVENTALSTWGGTSNITTTGTLTSGATGAGFTLNFGTSTLSGNVTGTNIDESSLAGLTTSNFASANISQWTNNSGYITASTTDTLTNKTIAAGSNTISGITASNLTAGDFSSKINSGTYSIDISGNAATATSATNATTVTNGVYTTGSYSNPAWITSLAGSKITGNISGNAATASNATDAVHANYADVAGTATNSAGLTCTNCVGGTQVDESTLSLTKSMVGLGNVENTALSTWAGTSSVTTTGTLTSGATGAGFTLNFGTSTLSGNVTGTNIDESTLSGLTASNLTAGDFSSKINTGTYSINVSGNAGDLSCTNCIGGTEIDESTFGAITGTSLNAGSGTITTSGIIGTASTTTFTGAGGTFSSAVAANGGITFDNATDTLGAFTFGGTVDAATNIITNIGNSGTDFLANGGLTLANALTVTTGGLTLSSGALAVNSNSITASGATLTINAGGNVDVQDALNADSLTSDAGVSIAAGQSYTGAGAVTLSSGGATGLTISGGAASTWNVNGTLSLQTTNNGAITTGNGQLTLAGNVDATNGLDVTNANLTVGGSAFTVDTTGAITSTKVGTAMNLSGAGATISFSGAGLAQVTTASNQHLALMPGGTGGVGVNTTTPLASFDVRGNLATIAAASVSARSNSFAAMVVNNSGTGDIFTASASGLNRFVIKNDGKVGIGTTLPGYRLEVQDDQAATAAAQIWNTHANVGGATGSCATGCQAGLIVKMGAAGSVTNPGSKDRFIVFSRGDGLTLGKITGNNAATGVTYDTKGGDFAEWFEKADASETFDLGDMVCQANANGGVTKCTEANNKIIGVISGTAGFIGNSAHDEDPEHYVLVGLLGHIKVKVSSQNGAITAGDMITVSDGTVSGIAGKATKAGEVVGQALESYDNTDPAAVGTVEAYVSRTWYAPTLASLSEEGGLDILSTRIASLEEKMASLNAVLSAATSSAAVVATPPVASSSELTLSSLNVEGLATISANLRVKNNALIEGILNVVDTLTTSNLIVSKAADFFGNVIFRGDVVFQGRPSFNTDTAGLALVKKDAESVDVTFDKEYDQAPLVNASISLDEDTNRSKEQDQAIAKDTGFIITNRTKRGFTILLGKPAANDIQFSWTALSVKDAKKYESSAIPAPIPTTIPVASDSGRME